MTRLTNVRPLGRFLNTGTGKEVNVKKGRSPQRGTDVIFYLYRGKRQFISDAEFYRNYKKVIE